ncbi:sulfite exporter TauE/SafE family protein [Flammeovirga aprica]|uniref:Probable membrane transporter protein n=1 Tax=Flammeovirga aprica JL-4 TaxID=694437 RepID=A0A7X9RT95_9BACT|nr:sulfite exporter TauE/SafE family protein [Flammeovirga aprica]NME66962.1 sulfite exporter TauE/SafE family protein [Flammeovirga aprica JL-4]
MDEQIYKYIFWFLVCSFSSVITSISGGGGMLSLPALIYLGLPDAVILGTNKVILTTASITATFQYHRKGFLKINRQLLIACGISLVMAVCGAELSKLMNAKYMLYLLLVIILFLFTLEWYKRKHPKSETDFDDNVPSKIVYPTAFLIGLYSGFFGPGTSVICFFILSFFSNIPVMVNVAFSKSLAMISSMSALFFFMMEGLVYWDYGLVGVVGAFLGSWIGAELVVKVNPKVVKAFFNVILILFLLKTLYDLSQY